VNGYQNNEKEGDNNMIESKPISAFKSF